MIELLKLVAVSVGLTASLLVGSTLVLFAAAACIDGVTHLLLGAI
jgi:hypothetical protein